MDEHHILYSYRRCPYAMRARYALYYAKLNVEIREISFQNKPQEMLAISPKGTVPVLQTSNSEIIDESIDIMRWALRQNDPDNWQQIELGSAIDDLISSNDEQFKPLLDQYKYFDRFGTTLDTAREQTLFWLERLESALTTHQYLVSDRFSLGDAALFPFLRQYRGVDPQWFTDSKFVRIQNWLNKILDGENFAAIMHKYPIWQPNATEQHFLIPGEAR